MAPSRSYSSSQGCAETRAEVRVISGCQTGVDRAALDAAIMRGLPWGGWATKGWRSEDGGIPYGYRGPLADGNGLIETPLADYTQRTDWNARDAGTTLVLWRGTLSGGTLRAARKSRCWIGHDLANPIKTAQQIADLLRGEAVVNVAGPRESKQPGIYAEARAFLLEVFAL